MVKDMNNCLLLVNGTFKYTHVLIFNLHMHPVVKVGSFLTQFTLGWFDAFHDVNGFFYLFDLAVDVLEEISLNKWVVLFGALAVELLK